MSGLAYKIRPGSQVDDAGIYQTIPTLVGQTYKWSLDVAALDVQSPGTHGLGSFKVLIDGVVVASHATGATSFSQSFSGHHVATTTTTELRILFNREVHGYTAHPQWFIDNVVFEGCPSCVAEDLVANGGFETGVFAPWTLTSNEASLQQEVIAAPAAFVGPMSGLAYKIRPGSQVDDAGIYQTIPTLVGHTYKWSLDVAALDVQSPGTHGLGSFKVLIDGVVVASHAAGATSFSQSFSGHHVATMTTTELRILFNREVHGYTAHPQWFIDNVVFEGCPSCVAEDLVANGGFETGVFAPWTLTSNEASLQQEVIAAPAAFVGPMSGLAYKIRPGSQVDDAGIYQTISTLVGHTYKWSLDVAALDVHSPGTHGLGSFKVLIDGVVVASHAAGATSSSQSFSGHHVATTTTTELQIPFHREVHGYTAHPQWFIDNVVFEGCPSCGRRGLGCQWGL